MQLNLFLVCLYSNNFENIFFIFSLESQIRKMNETLSAKEKQQTEAYIRTWKNISVLEENVQNLSVQVLNNKAESSRFGNTIQNSISSLTSSVQWILNFIDDLTQGNGQNKTGNSTVTFIQSKFCIINKS